MRRGNGKGGKGRVHVSTSDTRAVWSEVDTDNERNAVDDSFQAFYLQIRCVEE